jgi:anthranilate synthase component 1
VHLNPELAAMTHAPLIHPLPHPIDLLALQQHDPARFPLLMESTASGTAQGRWSLLLAAQGDGLRLDADGQVRDQHDAVQPAASCRCWTAPGSANACRMTAATACRSAAAGR